MLKQKMCRFKVAELLCTNLCGCFQCENNGLGEDDDKLPDEDADITDDNDGESKLDDGRELSHISNSYEDE